MDISRFIRDIPKAELHLHLEGTLEPELMFKIAKRNRIKLRFKTVGEIKKAYDFGNLQDFLDIYYEGALVLLHEKDFYDLTLAYLKKARKQNVLHAEVFFDPQTHTARGVPFSTVMNGIDRARKDARRFGVSIRLIMCFLRHLPEESAFDTLKEAMPFKRSISAVGLDSSEKGNPPSKFKRVFASAISSGFLTVAHAGEEGPSGYIHEALRDLKAERIDHGNRSMDDPKLVRYLREKRIPLTMCPLSNLKLRVIRRIEDHPLKTMMENDLMVSVNSDDPAYFGGYVNENYLAVAKGLSLDKNDILTLARNSFKSSFLSERQKLVYLKKVDRFANKAMKK
jgi:adenosine deaminase